nr:hypothetical protein HAV00_02915 [Bradyrhizobium symbiodeficiens]
MDGTQGKETPLLTQLRQRCRERDAPLQEGHREERPQRPWRSREEPQAGNRNRTVEGTQEGQEGPEEGCQENGEENVQEKDGQEDDNKENNQEIVEAQIQQALTAIRLRSCCPA